MVILIASLRCVESKRDQRMQCFPYVDQEESGYFAYGDGTVYYHSKRNVPTFLKEDNPEMRAVFVVRDPIDRLVSHFKFAYKSLPTYLQDVNRLVGVALRKDGGVLVLAFTFVVVHAFLSGLTDLRVPASLMCEQFSIYEEKSRRSGSYGDP